MRVKVCGITRLEDAELASELGAWAVGFVFWPKSPRFVEPERARAIVQALPPWVVPIGVFVDQTPAFVDHVARHVQLGAVQLHGRETPADYATSAHRVLKAVGVSDAFDPRDLDSIPARATVLLDAHDPVKKGGTGRTIDWSRAAQAARRRPVVLSGGLAPHNVGAAVSVVRPHAVDVSSGIEAGPGIKDPARMRDFFDALS
jgi:phosphoribosylanthranilate isomerase